MMNNKIRIWIAAMAVVMMAGCAGKEPGSEAAKEGEETQQARANKAPIEIVFQDSTGNWTPEKFEKDFASYITRKFPYITVKLLPYGKGSMVADLLPTGAQMDIIIGSPGVMYTNILNHGVQFDMTPLIEKHKYDLTRLNPEAVKLSRQVAKGGMYDIPFMMQPSPIVYNKDIFDKFGVTYPVDGMTWDEVYETAKKLTRQDGGVQYRGLFVSIGHLNLRSQLSLNYLDPNTEKAVVDSEGWKRFYENITRFYKLPGYDLTAGTAPLVAQRNMWQKDKTVAMWLPVSGAPIYEGINYDYAAFPEFEGLPGIGPQPYPASFYMTSMSKYKDDAFEVIAYLTSDEFQLINSKKGNLTVLNDAKIKQAFGQDAPEYKGKNLKAMMPDRHAAPLVTGKYNGIAEAEMTTAFISFVTGAKDLNTALRDASESINNKVTEQKAAGK
ncbi:MAG: extracellular solute-binding protein family 1 [Paenibacillus sp.]|jgi:multiple sugar transport system substrate-binding protein|nr:extracellular solute-binding protein family 1 [Paenibacillus sp.]